VLWVEETDRPAIGSQEVLVRIRAAGLERAPGTMGGQTVLVTGGTGGIGRPVR
jgi:NADPH:quinone reductase-like Zn-dependent oxidoreductase